jgi:hypothetical protein
MSNSKYIVPEEGSKAAVVAVGLESYCRADQDEVKKVLEAFIRGQSENPRVPTDKQVRDLINEEPRGIGFTLAEFAIEWQRQMYLAPEPEVPEEISDLLYRHPKGFSDNFIGMDQADENTREAYRRGKESK